MPFVLPTTALLALLLAPGCVVVGGVWPDTASCVPEVEEPYDGVDQDCDGVDLTDVDGDGWDAVEAGGEDCDDAEPSVHPDAPEVCNDVDDDCDGLVDGQDPDVQGASTWYPDRDGDGYGRDSGAMVACEVQPGWAAGSDDCDDTDPAVHPGAAEICDGVDDDCDGLVDGRDPDLADGSIWCRDADGDGRGDPGTTMIACERPRGWVDDCSDCDDADPHEDCTSHDDGSICAGLVGVDDGLVPAWAGRCDPALGHAAYGGHCYYAVSVHTTWPDARASCIAAGGYLVTVQDAGENAFVQGLNSRPYMGGCDGDVEGTWTWITGEAWEFTSWSKGEPNDWTTGEDCLENAYSGAQWNDIWCDRYSFGTGYVCEFE